MLFPMCLTVQTPAVRSRRRFLCSSRPVLVVRLIRSGSGRSGQAVLASDEYLLMSTRLRRDIHHMYASGLVRWRWYTNQDWRLAVFWPQLPTLSVLSRKGITFASGAFEGRRAEMF